MDSVIMTVAETAAPKNTSQRSPRVIDQINPSVHNTSVVLLSILGHNHTAILQVLHTHRQIFLAISKSTHTPTTFKPFTITTMPWKQSMPTNSRNLKSRTRY